MASGLQITPTGIAVSSGGFIVAVDGAACCCVAPVTGLLAKRCCDDADSDPKIFAANGNQGVTFTDGSDCYYIPEDATETTDFGTLFDITEDNSFDDCDSCFGSFPLYVECFGQSLTCGCVSGVKWISITDTTFACMSGSGETDGTNVFDTYAAGDCSGSATSRVTTCLYIEVTTALGPTRVRFETRSRNCSTGVSVQPMCDSDYVLPADLPRCVGDTLDVTNAFGWACGTCGGWVVTRGCPPP